MGTEWEPGILRTLAPDECVLLCTWCHKPMIEPKGSTANMCMACWRINRSDAFGVCVG